MAAWQIDPEHTRFTVSFEPGLPGVGVHVRGFTGTFDAAIDEYGRPDFDQPVAGAFVMTVDDLQLGNRLLTTAVRSWLGNDEEIGVTGTIGEVTPYDDERHRLIVALTMRGETHRLEGRGRSELTPSGVLRVRGRSRVDPRQLGVPIPKVIRVRSIAEWDLHLTSVT
jgi:hypothetical protein